MTKTTTLKFYSPLEYSCRVCNESFPGIKSRKAHMMEMHSAAEIGESINQTTIVESNCKNAKVSLFQQRHPVPNMHVKFASKNLDGVVYLSHIFGFIRENNVRFLPFEKCSKNEKKKNISAVSVVKRFFFSVRV